MNSTKETADIQSETADMVAQERRRRVSSADRERAKNDDNNNVHESTATTNNTESQNGHYDLAKEDAVERDDCLHRMAKCPSRNTEADDEEESQGTFSKTLPLDISIGADCEEEEEAENEDEEKNTNIDSLSKTLHINDEIINIIANSKHLLVNGQHQPQEIAAKNERVSVEDDPVKVHQTNSRSVASIHLVHAIPHGPITCKTDFN